MNCKASLDVIDQSEVFSGLVDCYNICNRNIQVKGCQQTYSHTVERTARGNVEKLTHETSWIIGVGADLAVNLDQTLHYDLRDLVVVQGVLETIT